MFDEGEENYWNTSQVSAFSFDDAGSQKAQLDAVRGTVKELASNFADLDVQSDAGSSSADYTEVDWSGKPASKGASTAERRGDAAKNASTGKTSLTPPHPRTFESASTHSDLDSYSGQGEVVRPKLPRRPLVDFSVSPRFSEERTSSFPRFGGDATKNAELLERENAALKRKLKNTVLHTGDPHDTVRRILKGDKYSLEWNRGLAQKLDLLNSALDLGDADAVMTVILFLQKSLNQRMFLQVLMKYERAMEAYLTYLREDENWDELHRMYIKLGRLEPAGMCQYQRAALLSDPAQDSAPHQISTLKRALSSTMSVDPKLDGESAIAEDWVNLLERQQPIEASDARAEASGDEQFRDFPRRAKLVDQPVLTTLYYCAFYHYNLGENNFASPLAVRRQHRISDKQFEWVCAKALSKRQRWLQINNLLTKKSLFGQLSIKTGVPMHKIVDILAAQKAAPDILRPYVLAVPDNQRRLKAALKYGLPNLAVDCFVQAGNMNGLLELQRKLEDPASVDYADKAILKLSAKR